MSEGFNPLKAAAILRARARLQNGPKLSITDKVQAFALLQSGVTQEVVAKMFGISAQSASYLANCLNRGPGRIWRYTDVFAEWSRLGADAFLKAYLTEENFLKASRLKYGVDDNATDDHLALDLPSNPRADSCSYGLIYAVDLGSWRARIDFVPCDDPDIPADKRGPDGWRYAPVGPDDSPSGPYVSIDPNDAQRHDGIWAPWRTSADCCDHLHRMMDMRNPRRGRPKKHA